MKNSTLPTKNSKGRVKLVTLDQDKTPVEVQVLEAPKVDPARETNREKLKNLLGIKQDTSTSSLEQLLKDYFPPETASPTVKLLIVLVVLTLGIIKEIKWVALIVIVYSKILYL